MSAPTIERPETGSPAGPAAVQDPNPVQLVRLVMRRELRERVRSKMMIGSTVIFLLIIAAAAVLPGILGGEDVYRVGVVGPASAAIADRLEPARASAAPDARLEVSRPADVAEGERRVIDGELDALIVDGRQVVVEESLNRGLRAVLDGANRQAVVGGALEGAGIPEDRMASVLDPPALTTRSLQPSDEAADLRRLLAFFGTMLLYVQLLMAGSMIASGVVEEKTSRVVELLLAKATPAQVLTGKVIGMGVLAFGQMLLFVGVGLGAGSLAGTIDLPPATVQVGLEVLAWFVLGYAIYACLFAVAGALAGRPEDLQNTSQVVSLVVLLGYGSAIFTFNDPDGLLGRVSTYVPFLAPMVQPLRRAAGVAPWWEAPVGVVLVLAGIVVAIRVAGRVYSRGALHFQGTMKLREALKR
jgi:ABC-2 type transport system permease protein